MRNSEKIKRYLGILYKTCSSKGNLIWNSAAILCGETKKKRESSTGKGEGGEEK